MHEKQKGLNLPSNESMEKLKVIQKEIEFIFSQGEIRVALQDESKRRAIFHAIIEIKENIRVLQENGENQLLSLFSEQDLKKIAATRNFAAHNSKEINPSIVANLVRFNLFDIKARIDDYLNSPNSSIKTQNFQNHQSVQAKTNKQPSTLVIVWLLFVALLALLIFLSYMIFVNPNDTAENGAQIYLPPKRQIPTQITSNDTIYPLETFTLNLLSNGGARYVKATIFFEFKENYDENLLDNAIPKIRDKIIRILTAKSFKEVQTQKGKEQLAEEIKTAINKMLKIQIERVGFSDFVVQ